MYPATAKIPEKYVAPGKKKPDQIVFAVGAKHKRRKIPLSVKFMTVALLDLSAVSLAYIPVLAEKLGPTPEEKAQAAEHARVAEAERRAEDLRTRAAQAEKEQRLAAEQGRKDKVMSALGEGESVNEGLTAFSSCTEMRGKGGETSSLCTIVDFAKGRFCTSFQAALNCTPLAEADLIAQHKPFVEHARQVLAAGKQ